MQLSFSLSHNHQFIFAIVFAFYNRHVKLIFFIQSSQNTEGSLFLSKSIVKVDVIAQSKSKLAASDTHAVSSANCPSQNPKSALKIVGRG